MADVVLLWRAMFAQWRARLASLQLRARRNRQALTSAALVIAGLAGMLGFASLVGGWCVGLVGMTESAGAVWFGLMRDDGTQPQQPGAPTVADILERARRAG